MGSVGNVSVTSTADYSQGYRNDTQTLQSKYRSTEEMREDGFRPLNDFSLSSLLRSGNQIAADVQPWNNRTVYFVWDSDWKRWMKAAEQRWGK